MRLPKKSNLLSVVFVLIILAVAVFFIIKYFYLNSTIRPLAEDFCVKNGFSLQTFKVKGSGDVQTQCVKKKNGITFINMSTEKLYDPGDDRYRYVALFSF